MSSTPQAESNARGASNAGAAGELFDENDEGRVEQHHDSSRMVTPGTSASSSKTTNGGRKRTLEQTEGTINAISFSLLAFLSFIRMILPLFFAFVAYLTFDFVISLLHSLL